VEQTLYHVLLEGRTVGPYDRRTIVGMRIKKTLTSEHVLITSEGAQLTVADLIGSPQSESSFNPGRSGSFSLVQATYTAALLEVEGRGIEIPNFKDEVEARVQSGVLRISGRFRQGLGWKEDRVKLPLADVVHARVSATVVDLWVRPEPKAKLQRISLELFTPEAAGELVDWLPNATPFATAAAARAAAIPPSTKGLMVAIAAVALTAVLVLVALLVR
jgi:hypothetical protein